MVTARESAQNDLYEVGMSLRRQVLGDAYVDRSLSNVTEFNKAMQEFTTAYCWGAVWDRPGLDKKQRSLINLAMLCGSGKFNELALHVRGALSNGFTASEIREVFIQVCIYCGVPSGLEAFKTAEKVFKDIEAEGGVIPQ